MGHQSRFLYRGQSFKCNAGFFPNIWFEINLLSGTAGTWLTANRDELAPKASDAIRTVILSALTQVVEADMARYQADSSARPPFWADLSLFLNVMALSEGDPWKGLAAQTDGAWKDVTVIGTSIRACFEEPTWLLGTGADSTTGPVDGCTVSTGNPSGDALPILALLAWEREKKGSVQVLAVDEIILDPTDDPGLRSRNSHIESPPLDARRTNPVLRFSRDPQPYYSDAAFAQHLAAAAQTIGNRRCVVAIRDEAWLRLALKKDFELPASWLMRPCASSSTVMLLPYLFTNGRAQTTPSQLNRLYARMQPLLEAAPTTEEVRRLYEALIHYIDHDLMSASVHAERWQAARA